MSWKHIAGAGVLLFGFASFLSNSAKDESTSVSSDTNCTIEYTPYEIERRPNHEMETSTQDELVSSGEEGQVRVCRTEAGSIVSSTAIKQPVAEIVEYGTMQPEPEYVEESTYYSNSSVRTGAECNDGTYSNATGRGACSHHGGVYEWLYE